MVEKMLSRSVRLMFVGSVAMGAGMLAQTVSAQEAAPQRVEITGSSIKRIAKEGALPVQTLSRKDIEQSGATNVADLVAALPAMQGMITASASVNGGGGGVQAASVHSIGTAYTLVLLNGRRMAPYGTGSAVNLASIPLSAVDRVEILTDGASTLYGSDAIAGVINFILKKNQKDFVVEATMNSPQKTGGKSTNFAISKGFGDLEDDGYNISLSYAHDEQKVLKASQREFSKSGVRNFSEGGKGYAIYQTSRNSIPANIDLDDGGDIGGLFSPDFTISGKCNGPNTFKKGANCRFDYASTVDLIPELKRDSLFGSASIKLGKDTTAFAELVASQFSSRAQYAPPAQPLSVISTDPVTNVRTVNPNYIGAFNKTVAPLLVGYGFAGGTADVANATMAFRAYDAGGRADIYKTDAKHLVMGVDTTVAGWDVNATYTHSENTQKDKADGGYMSSIKFDALVKAGTFNPFTMNAPGTLASAVLHDDLLTSKSKIDVASAHTSKELFDMTGGKAALGLGVDATKQYYQDAYAAISKGPGPQNPDVNWKDTEIGGGTGAQDLTATRQNWGAFGEMQMPVLKNLDITAAVRFDSYAAVKKENTTYDTDGLATAPGSVGNSVSKATYKLSARFQPTETTLLRASYGTGFKAPTMNNIADPVKNAGSSSNFPCPITKTTDYRFPYCKGASEYALLTQGNPLTGAGALRPETSKQFAAGIRLEPTKALSVGFDFWDVKLQDQIQSLSQNQIYTNPALADKYIKLYFDPIQGSKVIVAQLSPVNLASSHYQGIDWDGTFKTVTPIGNMSINYSGTYMLKAEQNIPGVGIEQSVGRFDSSDNVVFRVISRLTFTLKTSDMFTNSVTMNYKSGYHDKNIIADDGQLRSTNADGSLGGYTDLSYPYEGNAQDTHRDVQSYMTIDWQLKSNVNKNFTVTGGIRNLFNQDPPLSIRNTGGGNQVGYDGRYTDPLGRTYYLTGNYKF